ncbi:MAG: FeoB-associated Cys-rich membrane protein [Oscillospiraceae bacterium]|nr:FeoB-associated Cys-rich membrane protein [Oscillospiraceae bacterium]
MNWQTILIAGIVLVIFLAIVISEIRKRIQGKPTCSCGGSCGSCGMQCGIKQSDANSK